MKCIVAGSILFSWAQRFALRLKWGITGVAPVIPHFRRMRSIRNIEKNSMHELSATAQKPVVLYLR